jgi:hypothetical protein
MSIRRAFLWSMIVSLSLAALLGVAALTFGSSSPTLARILGTTALWSILSIVCLMQAIAIERRRLSAWMWVGMVSAGVAFLLWMLLIWGEALLSGYQDDLVAQTVGTLSIIACALGPVGLISLPKLHARWPRVLRRVVYGCVAIFVLLCSFMYWFEDDLHGTAEEVLWRSIGVFAILSAVGIIVIPVLWKLQGLQEQTFTTVSKRLALRLTCPRCASEQQISTGSGTCQNCGLRFRIDVEEPRCACGYLLFQLQGERCPECGRLIPWKDRWANAEEPAPAAAEVTSDASATEPSS